MRTCAVYLRPQGSVSSSLNSSQLFGAICWAIRTLFGEAELAAFLAQAETGDSFAVSSAFPCLYGKQSPVHFYPRPLLSEPNSRQRDALIELTNSAQSKQHDPKWQEHAELEINDHLKRIRKADFVSERIFADIVNGQCGYVELIERMMSGVMSGPFVRR